RGAHRGPSTPAGTWGTRRTSTSGGASCPTHGSPTTRRACSRSCRPGTELHGRVLVAVGLACVLSCAVRNGVARASTLPRPNVLIIHHDDQSTGTEHLLP